MPSCSYCDDADDNGKDDHDNDGDDVNNISTVPRGKTCDHNGFNSSMINVWFRQAQRLPPFSSVLESDHLSVFLFSSFNLWHSIECNMLCISATIYSRPWCWCLLGTYRLGPSTRNLQKKKKNRYYKMVLIRMIHFCTWNYDAPDTNLKSCGAVVLIFRTLVWIKWMNADNLSDLPQVTTRLLITLDMLSEHRVVCFDILSKQLLQ